MSICKVCGEESDLCVTVASIDIHLCNGCFGGLLDREGSFLKNLSDACDEADKKRMEAGQ